MPASSFVAVYFLTTFCNGGESVIDGHCGNNRPADTIELSILHSPECAKMNEDCQFDYVADLSLNKRSIGRIYADDQNVAQKLLLAVRPLWEKKDANDK